MIEVQELTRRYGDLVAVDDVTFRVNEGEVMGFLGPNAAGKTTTMRILTGYLAPHGGRAAVAGHEPPGTSERPVEIERRQRSHLLVLPAVDDEGRNLDRAGTAHQ